MRSDLSAFFGAYPWYQTDHGPLSFPDLFGNERPVEVEIGCGRGKFLIACALEMPEVNFLGLDRVGKWMKTAQMRRDRRKIQNLQFLKAEARQFLERLPRESVSVFHIYFPDPWPKKRHHKRRLVTAPFLEALSARLKPAGTVALATDDGHYFASMKEATRLTASCWKNVRESENCRLRYETWMTNYERKYLSQGKTLYYLELVK
jgi:tRNA (guanine-N7-)-methyltransferase